jgi:hypothetical protein
VCRGRAGQLDRGRPAGPLRHEEQAPVHPLPVFTRYAEEATCSTILAAHLNTLKVKHPYAERWEHYHFREMLKNPIYIGPHPVEGRLGLVRRPVVRAGRADQGVGGRASQDGEVLAATPVTSVARPVAAWPAVLLALRPVEAGAFDHAEAARDDPAADNRRKAPGKHPRGNVSSREYPRSMR